MYLTGSFGGSFIENLAPASADETEAGDVADGAGALVGPDGFDARADLHLLVAVDDDVRERRVGAVELHEHERERRVGRMQVIERLLHTGNGRDGARALHLDPGPARGRIDFGVAERRHDDALAG